MDLVDVGDVELMQSESTTEFRNPSLLLIFGLLAAPLLTCWFTLRKGYRPEFRRTVFTYTFIISVLPAIALAIFN
jgi:hypothetical protein